MIHSVAFCAVLHVNIGKIRNILGGFHKCGYPYGKCRKSGVKFRYQVGFRVPGFRYQNDIPEHKYLQKLLLGTNIHVLEIVYDESAPEGIIHPALTTVKIIIGRLAFYALVAYKLFLGML